MLKETETGETIGFVVSFLSWLEFQLGGGAPSGYAYALSEALKLNELQQSSRHVVYPFSTEIQTAGGV